MTIIPTDEDHPDFTRPSQFTSNAILAVTSTATVDPSSPGTFYTGGYEAMIVRATGLAGPAGFIFSFLWYADQALTVPTGQLAFRTVSPITISSQVPNRGPWCQVVVTTTTVAAKAYSLVVLPRVGTPSAGGAFLDGLIHSGVATSIGAGATNVQNAYGLTSGEGAMTVVTNATSWLASLSGYDETSAQIGAFGGLSGSGGGAQTQRVILPPYWTQFAITNQDAAPKFFTWAVQAAL